MGAHFAETPGYLFANVFLAKRMQLNGGGVGVNLLVGFQCLRGE